MLPGNGQLLRHLLRHPSCNRKGITSLSSAFSSLAIFIGHESGGLIEVCNCRVRILRALRCGCGMSTAHVCHKVVSGRIQRSISAGWSSHFGNSFTEIQISLEPISRTVMRTCIFLAITVCPCAHGFVAKKYIATVSNWMTLGEFILPVGPRLRCARGDSQDSNKEQCTDNNLPNKLQLN